MQIRSRSIVRLLASALALLFSSALLAQSFIGNGFMEGTYMELGIGSCGSFTTSLDPQLPDSGHLNFPAGTLSVVVDQGSDGWDVGSPNPYCGDYFLPGLAVEAFSLEIDSVIYTSGTQIIHCAFDDFGGRNIYNWRAATESINIWRAVGETVAIRQISAFFRDRRYVLNNINICNQSQKPFNEVYYMRTIDPDPAWAWNGAFATQNEILSQHIVRPEAAVIARSPINAGGFSSECIFGMSTVNKNARASFGGFFPGRPSDAWNEAPPYQQSGVNIADESVQMSWYWPQIKSGECICFSYAFVFDTADFYVARLSTDSSCLGLPPFNPENPFDPGSFRQEYDALNSSGSTWTQTDNGLNFFPNPGHGQLKVMHPELTASKISYAVYGLTGTILQSGETAGKPATIQMDGLPPGLYLIELRQGDLRLTGRYVLN